jgi:hypothetical protein
VSIGDIIPLIIIALVYLFGSSKRKKQEMEKKAQQPRSGPTPDRAEQQADSGSLRSKLDAAIREMYDDLQDESQKSGRSGTATTSSSSAREDAAGPQISARMRADRDHEQPADIDSMVAKTMYDRDVVDSSPAQAKPQPAAQNDQYSFHSQFDEVPNTTYHGHGFEAFNRAHGIHHIDAQGKVHYADDFNFAEMPGMYPTLHDSGTPRHATEAVAEPERKRFFRDRADLRRAIVAAEILGPPVALRGRRRTHLP